MQLAALNLHTVVNGRLRWDSVDRLTKAAKTVSREPVSLISMVWGAEKGRSAHLRSLYPELSVCQSYAALPSSTVHPRGARMMKPYNRERRERREYRYHACRSHMRGAHSRQERRLRS